MIVERGKHVLKRIFSIIFDFRFVVKRKRDEVSLRKNKLRIEIKGKMSQVRMIGFVCILALATAIASSE